MTWMGADMALIVWYLRLPDLGGPSEQKFKDEESKLGTAHMELDDGGKSII